MSGRLPVRAGGDGTMPVDGASGAGWVDGRAAAGLLPRLLNPPAGFIASSNNEIDRRSAA